MTKRGRCIPLVIVVAVWAVVAIQVRAEIGDPAAPQNPDPGSCVLQGVVSDPSGASIPGATLLLEPGNETAATTRTGSYCFDSVDAGTDGLLVVAPGFEERRISPVHLPEDGTALIDVVLQPVGISQSITVTATRTEKRLADVPVRTELVRADLIEFSAARTLADAVEFTSGIRVESNCQNCNFSQIRMLGLQGAYTQILFDGRPTLSSLAQVYGVEQIPTRMIEQIEVVKGGGSALYGPGSVGGVINVIPRRPTRNRGFFLSRLEWLEGVPSHSLSASGDWTSGDRATSLTAFGQADKVNEIDLTGDGFTEISRRRFQTAGFRLTRSLLKEKAGLALNFTYLQEDRRGGNRLDLPESEADIAESVSTRRHAADLSWRHTPNANIDYLLGISFAETSRDTYYGAGRDPNAYGLSQNLLWVVDGQVNHYFSRHILSWGGAWTSDHLRDSQPAYDRHFDHTHSNQGLFLQDDWFVAEGWEVIYGIRLDRHSEIDHSLFSPRLALMWSPRPTVSLRASLAKGFRAPQVFDEDLHIAQVGGEGQVIRNSEELRQETSTTSMVGIEWKPTWGAGVGLLEFNLFSTRISDLFHVAEDDDPSTPEREFSRINQGAARVYGVELNLGYAITDRLEIQGGLVEQRSRFDRPEPDFGSSEFFRTPKRYGTLTLLYRNRRWFDLFLGARFTGAMQVPHYAGYIPEDRLETSPSYTTLDASISRAVALDDRTRIIFTLGGKNLTNAYQEDLDQGPYRDSEYVWGPRFPRSFYVSAGLEF